MNGGNPEPRVTVVGVPDAALALNAPSLLQAPDSLGNMSGKVVLFAGSTLLLFGLIWLGACASLYAFATGYGTEAPDSLGKGNMSGKVVLFAGSTLLLFGLIWLGACASLYAFATGYGTEAPDSLGKGNMSGKVVLFAGSTLLLFGLIWLGACASLYAFATGYGTEAPDSLGKGNMSGKVVLFAGSTLLLFGLIWLGACASLYAFATGYGTEAPDSLGKGNMSGKVVLFAGSTLLLFGLIWLGACASLYAFATGYHVNVLYEARWMLATLLISGFLAVALASWKSETVFMCLGISLIYTAAAALTTLLIYTLNLARAAHQSLSSALQRAVASPGREEYMQLCAVLIALSLLGLVSAIALLHKLNRLLRTYYQPLRLLTPTRRALRAAAVLQGVLSLFSIYVTSQIITLSFSYIHTYMIQELFCGILLLTCSLVQLVLLVRPSRLSLTSLFFLNVAQFFQELFYTWNAYYISLYIHSSSSKHAIGLDYDQVVMTLNFLGHFGRMVLVGYAVWALLHTPPLCNGSAFRLLLQPLPTSASVTRGIALLAAAALSLGGLHIGMDILYASREHVYRTLIAFTGIAVFYASVIGLSLAIFLRSRKCVFPVLALVFATMLFGVSLHAIFVFLQTSFSSSLTHQLEQIGRSKRGPTMMHFLEAILALCGVILSGTLIFTLVRLLTLESKHEVREKLGWPLLYLRRLGWAIFALTMVETLFVLMVKAGWKSTDITLSYSVLDIMSTLVLCSFQLHVSRAENSRVELPLLSLFCLLLAEALTTFNYLSAYTTYIQLLLMLGRMPKAAAFADYFPISHLLLVLFCHIIQILQWVGTVCSAFVAAMLLERMTTVVEGVRDVELAASYANPAYDHPTTNTNGGAAGCAEGGEKETSGENRRNEEAEIRAKLCPAE